MTVASVFLFFLSVFFLEQPTTTTRRRLRALASPQFEELVKRQAKKKKTSQKLGHDTILSLPVLNASSVSLLCSFVFVCFLKENKLFVCSFWN